MVVRVSSKTATGFPPHRGVCCVMTSEDYDEHKTSTGEYQQGLAESVREHPEVGATAGISHHPKVDSVCVNTSRVCRLRRHRPNEILRRPAC
jgi:hypothetical protein